MKKHIAAAAAIAIALTCLVGCKHKSSDIPFDYDLSKYLTLGQYTGIEYSYTEPQISDEDVTKYIHGKMSDKGYGENKEVTDRTVKNGDTVNIKFVGKVDGSEFEGGTSDSSDLEIGSNSFIEGFEDGCIGMSVGETKVLNLKFPENYGKENLNGKDVEFTVTVNKITETIYPEFTDDIAKELSSDYPTADEYKKYASEQVLNESISAAESQKENDIWTKVMANASFTSVPDDEVAKYKELLLKTYDSQAQSAYNMTYEELLKQAYNMTLDDIDDELTKQAETATKQYMVVMAIAREQNLTPDDEEFNKQVEKEAASNGYKSTDEFLKAIDKSQFYLKLTIDSVMDFVVENAKQV